MFMLTFFTVILSLVAPIIAYFNPRLEIIKIFLTAWVTYISSLDLTVSPPFSFIFTVPFISHFILCPFLTVAIISHYSLLAIFSSYMLCTMTRWCLLTILQGIIHRHFSRLIHKMWFPQRDWQPRLTFISHLTNNQPPRGPFSSCYILHWIGVFCHSLFSFPLFLFTQQSEICDHIWYTCCMCPWRTFFCVVYFLWGLFLEPSFLDLISLVSFFRPIVSSRTNRFLSWCPCMLSLTCLHYKKLSKFYILQLEHQKHVP